MTLEFDFYFNEGEVKQAQLEGNDETIWIMSPPIFSMALNM
jgi:hypothetical protein